MPCYPIKQVESEELDKNIDVLCEYYLRMGATMPWSESIQHQLGLRDKKGGKIGEGLSKALAPYKHLIKRRN
jgi:hypothetical protein